MSPHDPGRKAETGGRWTIHHSSSTCSSLLKKDINQCFQNERNFFFEAVCDKMSTFSTVPTPKATR